MQLPDAINILSKHINTLESISVAHQIDRHMQKVATAITSSPNIIVTCPVSNIHNSPNTIDLNTYLKEIKMIKNPKHDWIIR